MGGETILVDGLHCTSQLSPEDLAELSSTRVDHAYHEAGYHMNASAPVLQYDTMDHLSMV